MQNPKIKTAPTPHQDEKGQGFLPQAVQYTLTKTEQGHCGLGALKPAPVCFVTYSLQLNWSSNRALLFELQNLASFYPSWFGHTSHPMQNLSYGNTAGNNASHRRLGFH